jgi:serine phosphatase RsbU (regulator of sigma subunit)
MSMIGSSLLNQIVNEKYVYEPDRILELLHEGVVKALKQQDSNNTDGMDVSLCCIEKYREDSFRVAFSGAKSRLIYVDSVKIIDLRSDNKSIGGMQKENAEPFTTQSFYVSKGDTVYMMTDGYVDTANTERKRFGTSRLLQELQKIQELSLE